MCGLTAILGNINLNIIIESLKQLQNRGYDSAGISIIKDNNFLIFKELFKESIINLEIKINKLNINTINFNNIIAHTRWATHGGITTNNCHPHISNNKKINLVHNGIIENYLEIKNFLINQNFLFYSETDTEVIVNLIEYYLKNNNIENAIILALNKCKGTWALTIQYLDKPENIYVIKNESPILIGYNQNFTIVTSEVSGFNNLITNYHECQPNQLYIISKNSINIFNNKNNIEFNKFNIIEKDEEIGEYKHFTLKEIYEQKNIIKKLTNNGARIKDNIVRLGGLYNHKTKIKYCNNLILFGCGTSYNACLYSVSHFFKLCNFNHVIALDACNFDESQIPKGYNCYIFVSQSGETKDLYAILKKIKYGITIGVINSVNSLIARTVDCGVYLNIGKEKSVASTKVFFGQAIMLVLIALYLNDKNESSLYKLYMNNINNLEFLINEELNKEIKLDKFNNGFIISDYNLFPIALEASLKFKEITYSHIEAMNVNSLKHGPLALVSEKNFACIILGHNESATQEILARNGKIININLNYDNIFNNLLYIIYLQKYNYLLSIKKGIDPDFPRNLAKVVTV